MAEAFGRALLDHYRGEREEPVVWRECLVRTVGLQSIQRMRSRTLDTADPSLVICDARATGSRMLMWRPYPDRGMPPTKEIKCTNADCFLDMFENHYTYDVPEDHTVANLQCPVCGGTDCLEEIEL